MSGKNQLVVVLADVERRVLLSIFDAMFADLGDASATEQAASFAGSRSAADCSDVIKQDAIRDFARRSASDCGDVIAVVESKLSFAGAPEVALLKLVLRALATPLGSLILMGNATPVPEMPRALLQESLANLFQSNLQPKRDVAKNFRSLMAVGVFGIMREKPGSHDGHENINWQTMGYEGGAVQVDSSIWEPFIACRVPAPLSDADLVVDCIVVGSGVGGGIMAAELTEAGFVVALVEVGQLQSSQTEFSPDEGRAARTFYQDGQAVQTQDREISILAGKAFGGGTSVNWSCSLPTPHHVRQEWARDFGLEWASNSQLSEAIDAVTERLDINFDNVEENLNPANQILMRGCRRLGYPAELAAQQGHPNADAREQGYCMMGLKQGRRQGVHGSALRDAAKTGRLLVLDGCQAQKVLLDETGQACGVWGSLVTKSGPQNVKIRSKAVVAAGGALQTPLLLKRSGLRNRNIGRHLRLHPSTFVWGRFDEEIRHYEGAPMTTVSRVVEDQDGRGYGAKIWVALLPPVGFSAMQPWHGPREYKHAVASYAHAAPLVCISRDTGEGVVEEAEDGKLVIKYSTSASDRRHLQVACERAAKILVAAGAREVHMTHQGVRPLVLNSEPASVGAHAELNDWLDGVRAAGMPVSSVSMGSAHQMGTVRMAASPTLGAAKPSGELWEAPGLFVADTSTFPTASGVNPMYTCASIAYIVAQQVKLHLQAPQHERKKGRLSAVSSPTSPSCSTDVQCNIFNVKLTCGRLPKADFE